MFKNSKKKITLGVSVQKFENKPNNWKILTYKRHTITIEELCKPYLQRTLHLSKLQNNKRNIWT